MPNWCYSSYSFSFDDPLKAEKYGGISKRLAKQGKGDRISEPDGLEMSF